jgi:hypothetical protein
MIMSGLVLQLAEIVVTAAIEEVISEKLNINTDKLDAINSKLDYLIETCDELILRELRAAYKSLEDYLMVGDNSAGNLLDRIEDNLSRNTGLDPAKHTGTVSNADIIAFSYYGLAFVSAIRNETQLAERYILRMFESGSRLARTDLAPAVFAEIFQPECQECYDYYEKRIRNQADLFDYAEMVGRGVASAAVLGGGFLLSAVTPLKSAASHGGANLAKEIMVNGTEGKVWKSKKYISEELEVLLDRQCVEVAQELLSQQSSFSLPDC